MTDTTVKFIVENQVFEFSTKCFQNPILSDSMLGSLVKQTWNFNPDEPIELHDIDSKLFEIVSQYILNDGAHVFIPDGVDVFKVHELFNRLSLDTFQLTKNSNITVAQYIVDKKYETIASGEMILSCKEKIAIERLDDSYNFDILNVNQMTGKLSLDSNIKIDCDNIYEHCVTSNLRNEKTDIQIYYSHHHYNENILYKIDNHGVSTIVHEFESNIVKLDITDEWVFALTKNNIIGYSRTDGTVVKTNDDIFDRIEGLCEKYCQFSTGCNTDIGIWDPVENKFIYILDIDDFDLVTIQGNDMLIFEENFISGYRFDSDKFEINLLWKMPLITPITGPLNLMFLSFDNKLPDTMTDEMILKEHLACTELYHYGIRTLSVGYNMVSTSFKDFEVLVRCINTPIINNKLSELKDVSVTSYCGFDYLSE